MHWADGGPSDLFNAALLCQRHHTIVHTRRYAGVLVEDDGGTRIEWDLTVGSYDRLLAHRAAENPRDPVPYSAGHSGVTDLPQRGRR